PARHREGGRAGGPQLGVGLAVRRRGALPRAAEPVLRPVRPGPDRGVLVRRPQGRSGRVLPRAVHLPRGGPRVQTGHRRAEPGGVPPARPGPAHAVRPAQRSPDGPGAPRAPRAPQARQGGGERVEQGPAGPAARGGQARGVRPLLQARRRAAGAPDPQGPLPLVRLAERSNSLDTTLEAGRLPDYYREGMPGYVIRDWEVVDYACYELEGTGLWFRGPAPGRLEAGRYFTAIGAAQTFGCFCPRPYPALLAERLGVEGLNLGYSGAGPAFFLRRP